MTLTDQWQEAGTRALKQQWTGKAIFLKSGSVVSYPVECDRPLMLDGKLAHATALLSSELHGMRAELGEAQRKDPSLREIIAVLDRKPAGEAEAAPRGGDFRRARTRAEDYVLGAETDQHCRWFLRLAMTVLFVLWMLLPR